MSSLAPALLLLMVCQVPSLAATDWVRAGVNTNQAVWGIRGGLLWALPPAGFRAREPRGLIRLDLRAVVNGRYMYWRSRQQVPGGIAFENFELRQRFREGQTFVFGITPRTPRDLGL